MKTVSEKVYDTILASLEWIVAMDAEPHEYRDCAKVALNAFKKEAEEDRIKSIITSCKHRIVDARNQHVTSGYLCVDCYAVFSAGDHSVKKEPLLVKDTGIKIDHDYQSKEILKNKKTPAEKINYTYSFINLTKSLEHLAEVNLHTAKLPLSELQFLYNSLQISEIKIKLLEETVAEILKTIQRYEPAIAVLPKPGYENIQSGFILNENSSELPIKSKLNSLLNEIEKATSRKKQ